MVDVVWTKVPEREGIGETIALRDRRRSGPDPQKEIGCASRAQFEAMCICLRHQVPMENRDHSDCPVELLPCPEHLDEQLKEMERFRTSDLATSEGDGENAMSKIMTARPRSDFVCGATETSTRSRKSRLISWLRWRRRSVFGARLEDQDIIMAESTSYKGFPQCHTAEDLVPANGRTPGRSFLGGDLLLLNEGNDTKVGTLSIPSGVYQDRSGLKHQTVSTGNVGPGGTAPLTLQWRNAFGDANYQAVCGGADNSEFLQVINTSLPAPHSAWHVPLPGRHG